MPIQYELMGTLNIQRPTSNIQHRIILPALHPENTTPRPETPLSTDSSRRSSGGDGCRRKNAQKAQRPLYLINREPHEINEQLLKKEFSSVSVLVSCWLFATTIRVSKQQNLGHPSCGGLGKPILRFSRLKFSVFSAVKKFLSVA